MQFPPRSPLRLVVLISGGGTTLRNLIEKIAARQIDARIEMVISSNANARGLQFAGEAKIPAQTIERAGFESIEAFSLAIFAACRSVSPDLIVMGGFLKLIMIPLD
ncbi:MAG TPA: formyltransferase family protein, partial [Pirellulales bacterium]|nr:formyltransferase family protein [Pirellulales bacterium]